MQNVLEERQERAKIRFEDGFPPIRVYLGLCGANAEQFNRTCFGILGLKMMRNFASFCSKNFELKFHKVLCYIKVQSFIYFNK
jgi:hypothetical protein